MNSYMYGLLRKSAKLSVILIVGFEGIFIKTALYLTEHIQYKGPEPEAMLTENGRLLRITPKQVILNKLWPHVMLHKLLGSNLLAFLRKMLDSVDF